MPALAEARGIPCTGSDAVGLGLSLDKYLTKVLAEHAGVSTPGYLKVGSMDQWDPLMPRLQALTYPVIAKPNHGGSSMGIRQQSRADSPETLREIVAWLLDNFADEVLVETFVFGREFTVGLLEAPAAALSAAGLPDLTPVNGPGTTAALRALPIAEIHIGDGNPAAFFSFEQKAVPNKDEVICPVTPPGESGERMIEAARRVFEVLGCRDMARVDFRLGPDGAPTFLEINPLPGLSPSYSTFPAQAEAAGISPAALVHLLVRNALARGNDTP
jgi:D-alanine-D-alanine ligase